MVVQLNRSDSNQTNIWPGGQRQEWYLRGDDLTSMNPGVSMQMFPRCSRLLSLVLIMLLVRMLRKLRSK